MNGSNKREYKNGLYTSPDGRQYLVIDDSISVPTFAEDDEGRLLYLYGDNQEEHEFQVDDTYGNLQSEIYGLRIDAMGNIATDTNITEIVPPIYPALPEFAYNDEGELLYYYEDDAEHVHEFTVGDENDDLQSDLSNLFISDNGYLGVNNISYEEMLQYIRLVRKHNKKIRLKVSLLNELYQEVANITGKIKGAPAYDIDSESDIRRTCSITLTVPAKDQIELDFEKTWNNRMVELSCGIYDDEVHDYVWFALGRMLMTSGNTVYDATTQDIKLNLVDLVAGMTQERGSQIGSDTLIPEGSNVRNVLISLITTFSPFKRYDICSFPDTIPYDLENSIGAYPIELVNNIIEVFPYYEYFFNASGQFVVREIPTKISDPVDISYHILDDLIISEKKSIDFSQIKNTTELYGKELSGEYTATACVTDEDCYNVTISASYTEPMDGETFTIVPQTDSAASQKIDIQETGAHPVVTVSGIGETTPIPAGTMLAGVPYVLRYNNEKYELQGELLIHCIVQEIKEEPDAEAKEAYKTENNCDNVQWIVNPDSPFACTVNHVTNRIQGEMKQVLEGGEFSNIYTTDLAYERASYENWTKCRLQDTVEIETILIPWMDVNDKIQYHSPVNGELTTWLVKSISYDFGNWTMTVKASRFYPYYPFWEEEDEAQAV